MMARVPRPIRHRIGGRRSASACIATLAACVVSCAPIGPEASGPSSYESESGNGTKVTVTKVDPSDEAPTTPRPTTVGATDSLPAAPLDPPAKPRVGAAQALLPTASSEAALPIPTTVATTRSTLFAFGRTRAGYVVRTLSTKGKAPVWSVAGVAAPAFDDDAPGFAIGDGDVAWFAVSSESGGTRVVRVDATASAPKVTPVGKVPAKLGRVASLVSMKAHVAVVGRDGDAITFARLDRAAGFLDATAKVLARGSAQPAAKTRAPRATNEDERLLLAWDADVVPGALDAPGTTPAERAAPKPGIYVRRFHPSGEPASPARRLTRPSFEAHALDVVVELGACAVLASTPDGFEMFRFVRKGNDLAPYGGGLHLAPPGGDVALGADVIGTIGITSSKLLRIGPGVKIVPSPLGFTAPASGSFDEVRVALDGYGAHALFGTATPVGALPTIARIDGEHMGAVLPTPWIGPPPQRLLFAAVDGDEGLALVVDAGRVQAIRFGTDGKPKGAAVVPVDAKQLSALEWPNAPVPRAARAGSDWIVATRDGRALVATGAKAGALIDVGPPKTGAVGGYLAVVPSGGKAKSVRVLWIPPNDRSTSLQTATVDPKSAVVASWTALAGAERNFGALGGARFTALPKATGGLWLLTNSGPKVPAVAQIYGLLSLDPDGNLEDVAIAPPAPLTEVSLVPTMGGPAIVATVTGKGVAARWLDAVITGWRDAFAYTPFRVRGDGPVVREKGAFLAMPAGALPVELGAEVASYLGGRCPFSMVTGPRTLLLACEEGAGDSPLAARVTTRVVEL